MAWCGTAKRARISHNNVSYSETKTVNFPKRIKTLLFVSNEVNTQGTSGI